MTHQEFNEFQAKLLEEVVGMKDTKGKEYANGESRFGNFDRLSLELGITPSQVGWVYCKKHLDSIASYMKNGKTFSSESIRGRFVDAITYLTLIAGMVEEKDTSKVDEDRGSFCTICGCFCTTQCKGCGATICIECSKDAICPEDNDRAVELMPIHTGSHPITETTKRHMIKFGVGEIVRVFGKPGIVQRISIREDGYWYFVRIEGDANWYREDQLTK